MDTDIVLRGCRRFGAVAASALMIAALGTAPAYAVNDEGFFELDANTADQSSTTSALPDDWESMTGSGGLGAGTLHTTKSTGIVADTNPAVFRNGSKDIQDISAWQYDLGSSPPKDNMLHAYAAAYTATTTANGSAIGDLLVYFGADRASFNGTASLGFWFFKNPVARDDATGRFVVPGTSTPAQHANGDTLVAFEYTNGGAVTGVRIFKWVGTGTSGSLSDLGTIGLSATNVGGVFCNATTDTICGATNPGNLTLPWNGTIQPGQFFEGGINISQVIGGDTCFASFMATSRASDEPNAALKNFILSQFPVCHVSVSKQCVSPVLASASTIQYTIQGQVLNDGGGPLSNIQITDNPALDANTLGFFTCDANGLPTTTSASSSSLGTGLSVCYRAKFTSGTNGPSDTVTVNASTGAGSVTGTANAQCPVLQLNPGLTVTKICDVDLVAANSQLSVKINYSGTVQNTGDVALTDVKVCEVHEGAIPAGGGAACDVAAANRTTFNIGTLAAGASATYSGFYVPSEALTGALQSALLLPHTAVFKDKAGAEGTPPAILAQPIVKTIPVEATCPMCPAP